MEGREACSRPDLDGEDAFKVLVTSDNHLGYMERDPIRGDDSFRIFEEILGIASDKKVCFSARGKTRLRGLTFCLKG